MSTVRKILSFCSISVLVIAFLSLYGYWSQQTAWHKKPFGKFTGMFRTFISFPETVIDVLTDDRIPDNYIKADEKFEEINLLDYKSLCQWKMKPLTEAGSNLRSRITYLKKKR